MREGHENSWRGHNHDRKKEEMHTPPKGGKGENAGKKTDFGRCIFSLGWWMLAAAREGDLAILPVVQA